jgi:hypothetical protein
VQSVRSGVKRHAGYWSEEIIHPSRSNRPQQPSAPNNPVQVRTTESSSFVWVLILDGQMTAALMCRRRCH